MAYATRAGGDGGGGFCNHGMYDPQTQNRMSACGDTWGFHISADGGSNWHKRMRGCTVTANGAVGPDMPTRATWFSLRPGNAGRCYIGQGLNHATNGTGYFGWVDLTESTSIHKGTATGGFGTNLTGSAGQPRPAGQLIVSEYVGGGTDTEYVYLLTPLGLKRTLNGGGQVAGDNSTTLGLAGPTMWRWLTYIDANTLYAVTWSADFSNLPVNTTVYKVTGVGGPLATCSSVTATPVTGLPSRVNAIKIIGGNQYAACIDGVYLITNNGNTWTKLSGTVFTGECLAIGGTGDTIYAVNKVTGSNPTQTILRSTVGAASTGASWSFLVRPDRSNVSSAQWGDGSPWWLYGVAASPDRVNANPHTGSGSPFVGSNIDVDPFDSTRVTFFGPSGAWQTRDTGLTFRPCMNGLQGGQKEPSSPGAAVIRLDGPVGAVSFQDVDYVCSQSVDHNTTAIDVQNPGAFPGTSAISRVIGGSTYTITTSKPADITKDGSSIADEYFRNACIDPGDLQVDQDGTVYIAQSGGGTLVLDPNPTTIPATAWQQLNPHGSGFQNTGAIAPWTGHDTDLIGGGDTSGLHKTVNKGHIWSNRDGDLTQTSMHAASIEPHPTVTGRWFALMGNNTTGGLWESTDNGDTWTNVSSGTANIWGNGALAGNSGASSLLGNGNGEHPRSVGRLITIDTANGYIYVATFSHGVYRGILGGASGVTSWSQIYSTANTYTRGIVYDPGQDVLYFSTFSDPGSNFTTASGHVWRSTNPRAGSPSFTQLTGSPFCCSVLLVLSDRLYTTAHPITANLSGRGVWYLDSAHNASAGTAWTKITQATTAGSQRWMSLDGYKVGPTTTLWAGTASSGATSLIKLTSTNGTTWTGAIYPTTFVDLQNDMGGPNTPVDPWWMYTARKSFMLGQSTFVASTIRINPQNTQEVYVFGRSGVWQTKNGGTTWYPVVKGIGATVTLVTICDPRTQGNVFVGLGDWSILASQNDLATVTNPVPPSGSFTYSMCIDESVNPTALIAAASPRQDVVPLTSNIYRNENVFGGGAWIDTGFAVSGQIVVALSVVYSGATRVFIAGDSGGNMWRKVGNAGTWAQVPAANMTPNGGIALTTSDTQPIARDVTRAETYLYDRGTGVWRSTDAGLHWTRIWNHAAGNSSDQSGWVDVDPTSKKNLFVSDSTSVYKITDADTCAQDAATVVTLAAAIGAKGPMAVDKVNKRIGLCDITTTAKFWESDMTNIAWTNKSDSLYINAAGLPQWLSYDTTGSAHVALSGNGVISETGAILTPPSITQIPTITGAPVGGTVLRGGDGTATGSPAPAVSNRVWLANAVQVGTGATYTVPTNGSIDGQTIQFVVYWTNGSGTTVTGSLLTAAVTQPVDPTPVWSVLPSITGQTATGTVGDVLTGHNGTVSPGSVTTKKWQTSPTGTGSWTDSGNTTTTLTLVGADVGSYKRYVPHAVNSGTSADEFSIPLGPVIPATPPNTPPTLRVTGPADVVVLPATALASATASDADGIAGVTVSLDQGTPAAMVADGLGGWSLDLGALSVGAHTVDVVATDSNASPLTTAASKDFIVNPQPSDGGGGGGGGVVTISTDVEEIELRIHQRGLQ